MGLYTVLVCLALVIASAYACTLDVDCNLNGVCVNGACQCDYSWSGEFCTSLNFKPVAPFTGAYGYSPNVTAWGGLPVKVGDTYHLLVTEMVNHCGLCTWGSNSHIIHATSDNLLGPYTYQNEALPVWSHNPHIMVVNSTGTPVYLLFHIGTADGGVTPKVCTGEDKKLVRPLDASGVLHVASDPAGPYIPQNPPGLGGCNNPTPYLFPNGTILLVCSQGGTNVYYADNWKGPWNGRSINYSGDPGQGIWEDPFIWRDKRGVFKMLAHVYPEANTMPHFWSRVSGFAYSYDGFDWVRQPWQPFTNVVQTTNGTYSYTTRERPKIFFDTDGTPLALFSGVAEGTNCWDCKEECGVDWTFNIAVEIAP